jgi:hypothetical protein
MVLSEGTAEKSQVAPPGIDPGTVRLVAQCLNHYAIPGPQLVIHLTYDSQLISYAVTFFVRYRDTIDFLKEPGIKVIISCAM